MRKSVKLWLTKKLIGELYNNETARGFIVDNNNKTKSGGLVGLIKRIGLRNGDVSSKDFEPPESDLKTIQLAYKSDAYIRQGVDKYVDQTFKEGFDFFGKNPATVDYIKQRLRFMALATSTPTKELFVGIAEDVVKYSNCIIVKARAKDSNELPQGVQVTGLNGSQPVSGYFCINATQVKVKRDRFGTVQGYIQESEESDKPIKFKPEDVIHIYYKREKGNAFGTPILEPVLDDVRALRQAEENVLKMMYRSIYPFYHVAIGDDELVGQPHEIDEIQEVINTMDEDGGFVTTNRVVVKAVASDKVINAEPYLRYMEDRVFSGMGIPPILFGRGNTANRSTGENMASEMGDRIKAIQKTIEEFINSRLIDELLLEGGYDTVLNPDDKVEFRFRDNDLNTKIKSEVHAIYKYEHNCITEDEMRHEMGMEPISDRSKMHVNLITQEKSTSKNNDGENGNKETNNKQKPTNQHGTKTSPKKLTNSYQFAGMVKEFVQSAKELVSSTDNAKEKINYLRDCFCKIDNLISIFDINDVNVGDRIKSIKKQYESTLNCVSDDISSLADIMLELDVLLNDLNTIHLL